MKHASQQRHALGLGAGVSRAPPDNLGLFGVPKVQDRPRVFPLPMPVNRSLTGPFRFSIGL